MLISVTPEDGSKAAIRITASFNIFSILGKAVQIHCGNIDRKITKQEKHLVGKMCKTC